MKGGGNVRVKCDECGTSCDDYITSDSADGTDFFYVDGQHFCEDCWRDNLGRFHMEAYWASKDKHQRLMK